MKQPPRTRGGLPHGGTSCLAVRIVRTEGARGPVIIVPTKVSGKAVVRNRLRRKVREAMRATGILNAGKHRVILTVRCAELPAGSELNRLLFELLKESGMMSQ